MKNTTLFRLGTGCIALQIVLHFALKRAGYASDVTDFLLGVLIGVGIALMILYLKKARLA